MHAGPCPRAPRTALCLGKSPVQVEDTAPVQTTPSSTTTCLHLQNPRQGPQAHRALSVPATSQTGSLRPRERDDPKAMQHIRGRPLEASQAARTKLVATCSHVAPPGSFPRSTLGGKVHITGKGLTQRHRAVITEPQHLPRVSYVGMRGTFWHTSCHTLRGQLSRVGPSLSSPL